MADGLLVPGHHRADRVIGLPVGSRGCAELPPKCGLGSEAAHRQSQRVIFVENIDTNGDGSRLGMRAQVRRRLMTAPRAWVEGDDVEVMHGVHDDGGQARR